MEGLGRKWVSVVIKGQHKGPCSYGTVLYSTLVVDLGTYYARNKIE